MNRATSAEAYTDLETKGVLKGQRLEVQRAFQKYGPGTAAEVLNLAGLGGNLNLTRARVSELANAGYLVEVDTRTCKRSGRRAIVWQAIDAGDEPKPLPQKFRVYVDDEDMQTAVDFAAGKIGALSPRVDKIMQKIIATGRDEHAASK